MVGGERGVVESDDRDVARDVPAGALERIEVVDCDEIVVADEGGGTVRVVLLQDHSGARGRDAEPQVGAGTPRRARRPDPRSRQRGARGSRDD